jgi:hypothetical protein
VAHLLKNCPTFYGTRRFITVFTTALYCSLSCAGLIQSIPPLPPPISYALILSSHLRLGLPSSLFPSALPTKTMYSSLFSHLRVTCPSHLILHFITLVYVQKKLPTEMLSLCKMCNTRNYEYAPWNRRKVELHKEIKA